MKQRIFAAILAAIALALAPAHAAAQTRAGDSRVVYASPANGEPGLQRASRGEETVAKALALDLKAVLIGSAALAALLALLVNGGSQERSFQSNGAN